MEYVIIKNINELKKHIKNEIIYGQEDITELVQKIKEYNYIKPLIINKDNIIISGHRRYEACKLNGINDIPCIVKEFKNDYEELELLLLENEFREKTVYQKVKEGEVWEEIERIKAEQRKLLSLKQNQDSTVKEKFPERECGQTRDIVAQKIGLGSGKSYESAKNVVVAINKLKSEGKKDDAKLLSSILDKNISGAEKIVKENILQKATPELKDKLKKQDISIKKVIKDIKTQENREEKQKQYKNNPLPEGLFDVIYADPPYEYEFSETQSREIESHYKTMTLEDIKSLKIPVANNAVLFLWATAPKLEEAMQVINIWGFKYKTCMVWDKQIIGTGYWCRNQHELLLIATKGNMPVPVPEVRVSSVYSEKRTEHSKKPNYYYSLIEKYFPNHKYLELFARQKYNDKWTAWGNEL